MSKHIIIYSHGFGVQRDDRRLLSDIAAALPDADHILFDYNTVDNAANTLTVSSLQSQAAKLKGVVAKAKEKAPNAVVDIVAHSQGCVVAAIARPVGIRRAVFLAPPEKLDSGRLIRMFSGRAGSEIDINGTSKLARRDGSTTIVPAAYWRSLDGLQPIELYNRLSETTKITIVGAEKDEVLGACNFDSTSAEIDLESMDADHDFTGSARKAVIELIRRKLS